MPLYPLYTPRAHSFYMETSVSGGAPFTPEIIGQTYGLSTLRTDGTGITIACILAYKNESVESDFRLFGERYDLPESELEVYYPDGTNTYTFRTWSIEASADTQWAYAAAPAARIMCVFAFEASIESMFSAVQFAVGKGADIISMSWGSPEFIGQEEFTRIMKESGAVFIASAGDVGGEVYFPSSSDAAVSVGGTVFHRNRDNDTFAISAWENGGGGPSEYTGIPYWQSIFEGIPEKSGAFRATPDVALDACTDPGYSVYNRDFGGGFTTICGTSVSAPIFSGMCARLLQRGNKSLYGRNIASYLYTLAGATQYDDPQYYFDDVIIGSNGRFSAGVGYDLCTGLGVPVPRQIIEG